MKIGLITHYMPPHNGGIERVAELLFTAYTQRGLEVRWVASRSPAEARPREGSRVRVPCWNILEARLGVPVPLWGPAAWNQVKQLALWADVLHVHDCLYPGSILAATFGRSTGTPVVVSQHVGFVPYRAAALALAERAAFGTLGRWVLRRACRLVFATPAAEAYVTQLLGEYPRNARPIPNGIDTARFHPASPRERQAARRELGLPDGKPVILFIGRLVEKKRPDWVVAVSRRLPDAHFLIVGDGPLAGAIPEAINITWHRSINPDRVHACYHASDCFLLPSQGEGLPVAVQEAAACGLPIVVAEGEIYAGPLVEGGACAAAPPAPDAIAGRVSDILAGRAAELGPCARRYAESHWSLGAMTASYVALLEEAMAEQQGKRKDGRAN